jgi:hypothetical protein
VLGEKMAMKKVLMILLLVLLLPTMLIAQEENTAAARQYGMGSQMFTFRLGPVVPTFIYQPVQDSLVTFPDEMRMQIGGYGSIRYQGFLNSTMAIGGELGYLFAFDRGSELFTSVPMQAKLTYIPLQGTFELPLSIGLGIAYNSYTDETTPTSFLSLLATAEAGFSWYFKEEWGITLSAGLQLIPELFPQNHPHYEDLALTGFMPITLSVTYRSN